MGARNFGRELFGLFLLFLALFLLLALASFDEHDPSLNQVVSSTVKPKNMAGMFGAYVSGFLNDIFGVLSFLWPIVFAFLGVTHVSPRLGINWSRWCGWFLMVICLFILASACDFSIGHLARGGQVGDTIYAACALYLSPFGTAVAWLFLFLSSMQLIFDISWLAMLDRLVGQIRKWLVDRQKQQNGQPGTDKVPATEKTASAQGEGKRSSSLISRLVPGQTHNKEDGGHTASSGCNEQKPDGQNDQANTSLPDLGDMLTGARNFLGKLRGLAEILTQPVPVADQDKMPDLHMGPGFESSEQQQGKPSSVPGPSPSRPAPQAQDPARNQMVAMPNQEPAGPIQAQAGPRLQPGQTLAVPQNQYVSQSWPEQAEQSDSAFVEAIRIIQASDQDRPMPDQPSIVPQQMPVEPAPYGQSQQSPSYPAGLDVADMGPATSAPQLFSTDMEQSQTIPLSQPPVVGIAEDHLEDQDFPGQFFSDQNGAMPYWHGDTETAGDQGQIPVQMANQTIEQTLPQNLNQDLNQDPSQNWQPPLPQYTAPIQQDTLVHEQNPVAPYFQPDMPQHPASEQAGTAPAIGNAYPEQVQAIAQPVEAESGQGHFAWPESSQQEGSGAQNVLQDAWAGSQDNTTLNEQQYVQASQPEAAGQGLVLEWPNPVDGAEDGLADRIADDDQQQGCEADSHSTAAVAPQMPEQPARRPEYAPVPLPSTDLLVPPAAVEDASDEELHARGELLMQKLGDFGVTGELVQITPGPVVTMFEMRPSPGIRVSRVLGLADDIALALKALSVRIQAPIPGTDTVGIEVPNEKRQMVNFRELAESENFVSDKGPLTMVLGKDIAGRPYMADLSTMPHLLVAGATGAGKSVCLNGILVSLLYRTQPRDMRLLLVDPKRIEMAVYADEPHLIHPVVTETEDAQSALEWAVSEMDRRYKDMARLGARNITSYNQRLAERRDSLTPDFADLEHMPYLVIVIDELADLMMTAGREVEQAIVRLAQLARAAGIHMILATQRPSVDVVTGLIKANFPCRISFQVTSMSNSRTILDQGGAESLLGKGDMLFKPNGKPLVRLHGPFLSDDEVHAVVSHWKYHLKPDYVVDFASFGQEANGSGGSGGKGAANDPLYKEVVAFVMEHGSASTSLVQRHFRIGYNRAATIMDQLQEDGLVGPANGSKPRAVIR